MTDTERVLSLCDAVEALDLEYGRTLILSRDSGRGDLSTYDLRKFVQSGQSVEDYIAQRRAMFNRTQKMVDDAFKHRSAARVILTEDPTTGAIETAGGASTPTEDPAK